MKKIFVIIPMVLSLIFTSILVGCSKTEEEIEPSNQNNQASQVSAASDEEIKLVLKDMYDLINKEKDNESICKEELEKFKDKLTDEMIANEKYGADIKHLKKHIENYDFEIIAKELCEILNEIEGKERYILDLNNTNNENSNKSSDKNLEKSSKSKDTTKSSKTCPYCNDSGFNGAVCSKCGYSLADKCPKCGYYKVNYKGNYPTVVSCPRCGYKEKIYSDPPENNNKNSNENDKNSKENDKNSEDSNNKSNNNEEKNPHESACSNCGSATINEDGTCPYCGHQN